jgi:hypothetical protein
MKELLNKYGWIIYSNIIEPFFLQSRWKLLVLYGYIITWIVVHLRMRYAVTLLDTYLIGQGNWKSTSFASGFYVNMRIVTHALGESWPR